MNPLLPFALVLASTSVPGCAQDLRPTQPAELGLVKWHRDLDGVLAKTPEKPVLVLFQEIPG